MKALELVNAMIYDSSIAEFGGLMTMPIELETEERRDKYCEGYFGTQEPWGGLREDGAVYFYYYMPDDRDDEWMFNIMGCKPDAWSIRPKEGDMVALWKIEEQYETD